METLAYLHLALANDDQAFTDDTASISTPSRPQLFENLNQRKVSMSTAVRLLSLGVALGIVGMARQASAAVQQGDRGQEVSSLQERLLALGYFKGNITGYFGSVTKGAVIEFQEDKGLTADGVVGTNTEDALREQLESNSQEEQEASSEIWQLGDRGEQVSAIQKSLVVAGFFSGEDGIFDEATQKAVQQFQQEKGLKVDGIVGEQTLAALPASKEKESEPKPKPAPQKSTTNWFEDQDAPLSPFTRSSE